MFNELKGTIPHRNSETNPPHCQCCLQVSKTQARCSNSSNMLQNWVGRMGLTYFSKVDHSRISGSFSRNWFGLYDLSEILNRIYTVCKGISLVTVYLLINASKCNLNETTRNACITNSKSRVNCLEFLVYFNKNYIF